ncbi:MAG: YHYH domain-containing protein [Bacteroidaceae bacterium]|nr:YHYH domain-containing protein [Bacteroidaceae bacterium]
MKKLLAIFVSLVLLSVVVYAHSGGTDGSGGHYNRSTGEYHYHHGYSAHQHTDMDGDGILDCPYNFDDSNTYERADDNTDYESPSSNDEPQIDLGEIELPDIDFDIPAFDPSKYPQPVSPDDIIIEPESNAPAESADITKTVSSEEKDNTLLLCVIFLSAPVIIVVSTVIYLISKIIHFISKIKK